MNIAIIFAGGKGTRMKSEVPKQFLKVNNKPIIIHTLELFQNHKMIDKIYISTLKNYISELENLVKEYMIDKVCKICEGGKTAQDSIYNALKEAEKENDGNSVVLLHDGVRPMITDEVITKNIKSVQKYGSAITSLPAYETFLISENGKDVSSVPVRDNCYIAQAPQSFFLKDIISAHDTIRLRKSGYKNMVDACTIFNSLGINTRIIEGNRFNRKITTIEDVYIFKAYLDFKNEEKH